jgi:hypothetical protein
MIVEYFQEVEVRL